MRLEAAIAQVPFTPPSLLTADTAQLFEYDEDVKAGFDEYMRAVTIGTTLDENIAAHMRLYYGWLKARYEKNPCDVYKDVCGADAASEADLQKIAASYSTIAAQTSSLNWRNYMHALSKTNAADYQERVRIAGEPIPLSADEDARYQAWLNPPQLSEGLLRFFDRYVHDSRAGFQAAIGKGLYLSPREIIGPSGEQAIVVAASTDATPTAAQTVPSSNQYTPERGTYAWTAPSASR
jgi:hypothetical protein